MTKLADSPLPELSVWQARSTYLSIYAISIPILRIFGLDLEPTLYNLGLPAETLATLLVEIAPYIAGMWAWLERRAPRYKLVWWRS